MSEETTLTPASFFSKTSSEEGKKLFLKLPGEKQTDAWLLVQGRDSDAYCEAYAEYRMKNLEMASKGSPTEIEKRTILVQFLSKLVKGWSFVEPFSRAAVIELLTQAPYIREDVDVFVHDRERFFG